MRPFATLANLTQGNISQDTPTHKAEELGIPIHVWRSRPQSQFHCNRQAAEATTPSIPRTSERTNQPNRERVHMKGHLQPWGGEGYGRESGASLGRPGRVGWGRDATGRRILDGIHVRRRAQPQWRSRYGEFFSILAFLIIILEMNPRNIFFKSGPF
jgi:hypothetical protein